MKPFDSTELKMPELTLDPIVLDEKPQTLTAEARAEVQQVVHEIEQQLTVQERQSIDEFAKKIDITNTNMILQYGAAAQTKIASFSEQILGNVQTKDLGEVGSLMSDLVGELKGFSIDEQENGFFNFFKKAANNLTNLKAKYAKADTNVDRIVDVLEKHQVTLMKDIAVLDEMYRLNLLHFKELSMYILAGKKRLQEFKNVELVQLMDKATRSNLPEDAQAVNDAGAMVTRFEKKIHDLELTRAISIQMAPQIRMVQNNDALMVEKIQSSLVNTIPLWKSQMVLALGLANSKSAMESQRKVTDLTNELLKRNADVLKQGTIDVAKESERGIVELETLQHTSNQLISTLDEVLKIQEDGRNKRAVATQELARIESNLKQKLLEIRG